MIDKEAGRVKALSSFSSEVNLAVLARDGIGWVKNSMEGRHYRFEEN